MERQGIVILGAQIETEGPKTTKDVEMGW